jgi:organic hydroperoxide reductase OsmC/OhrA
MRITATIGNRPGHHEITVRTDESTRTIAIPPKASGGGSSANGGELLFLALATCYCNDVYREAAKRGITVRQVDVEVSGEFGGVGEPARGIAYRAAVVADATEEEIAELMAHTDRVAEIQNTLRAGVAVTLAQATPRASTPGTPA